MEPIEEPIDEPMKKPPEGGFSFFAAAHPDKRRRAQALRAGRVTFRRLLSRAALFLWKMPLSATLSTMLCALAKSSLALVLSPAATAFSTFLTAVRYLERSEVLAALILRS